MADTAPPEPSKDSLGLDLDSLKISDDQPTQPAQEIPKDDSDAPAAEPPVAASTESPADTPQLEDAAATELAAEASPEDDKKVPPREKRKPYINPERVKTGGAQREKLSDDELVERMARIREQNEKIKQRRADVVADEQEFKKTQEVERLKQVRNKKVQENVDRAREQNARRKLDKIQNREWDSGKPGVKSSGPPPSAPQLAPQTASIGIRGGVRGGGGGRGRGRGRGGPPPRSASDQPPVTSPTEEKPAEAAPAASS